MEVRYSLRNSYRTRWKEFFNKKDYKEDGKWGRGRRFLMCIIDFTKMENRTNIQRCKKRKLFWNKGRQRKPTD